MDFDPLKRASKIY